MLWVEPVESMILESASKQKIKKPNNGVICKLQIILKEGLFCGFKSRTDLGLRAEVYRDDIFLTHGANSRVPSKRKSMPLKDVLNST